MNNNFNQCLQLILREEGGNDDDPQDHGGRTSRGITQREYDAYCRLRGKQTGDVWKASQEDVTEIYHDQYWLPYCDSFPAGVDLVFFDFCVNAGRQQAVKALQRALGVTADGMYGIRTRDALTAVDDVARLIHAYSEQRRAFYQQLRQFPRYGKGWLNRTARIERAAAAMANVAPVNLPTPSPKADPGDVSKPPVSPETGSATTGISGILSYILDQLQQLSTQLHQYDSITYVKYALLAITVIGAGLTIYGFIHRAKQQKVI